MNLLKALDVAYGLLKSNNISSYKIDSELLLSDSFDEDQDIFHFFHFQFWEFFKDILRKILIKL